MFTYVELLKLTPEGPESLAHVPEYLKKIRTIIVEEGGTLKKTYAFMGPSNSCSIVKYPDNEAAFRVLAKIGLLEVVKTQTFPAEASRSSRRRSCSARDGGREAAPHGLPPPSR